jgi:hypothetical protein
MSDDTENLPQKLEKAIGRSANEHLLNVLKAALATAPFTGGIASLMTDYIPSMKQRRLEEFAEQVATDLKSLQDRVEEARLLTDEFAFVFEKCFRGAAEHHQQEKLDAFRGILVNSAIGADVANDENDYFLGLVNSLSALHLRILSFMSQPQAYLESHEINSNKISGGFSQFMPVAIPSVDIEVIKNAFGDLYQAGFINTDKTIFSTMTAGGGFELLGDRVSDLGKRFIAFCTSPA